MTESAKQPLPLWIRVSVIYLSLPLLPFLAGWCRLWIALPVMLCLSASLWSVCLRPGFKTLRETSRARLLSTVAIATGALAFAAVTGLIDWVPQSNDYLKHQLLLSDLVERPWPVRYANEGAPLFLCYGLGHYLVPASIAKVLGVDWLGISSFLWSSLGILLVFIGVRSSLSKLKNSGILIFLLCSGLGAGWHLFKSGFLSSFFPGGSNSIDTPGFLSALGIYTSNLDSFTRTLYQPQHAIAGWLGGLVVYELLILRSRWTESALVLTVTIFWSPLTALGIAAIGITALAIRPQTFHLRPVIHLASAGMVAFVLATYFLPHLPIAEKGFIWDLAGDRSWLGWYALFVSLFVLVPASAVFWLDWKRPFLGRLKPVVLAMTVVLLGSPLFKLGYFGDMRMQLSGPAFLFIALGMTQGLLAGPARAAALPYAFLCITFLAGAAFPLFRTFDNVVYGAKTDYRISKLKENGLQSIQDLRMPGFDVTAQYLGRSESEGAKLILKPAPTP